MARGEGGLVFMHDDDKTMRQQALVGGIAIKAYSARYDANVAVYNIRPNDLFGGVEQAIADVKRFVKGANLLAGRAALAGGGGTDG